MSTGKPQKSPSVLGALMDFIILVLLVGGAGFGGYWYGTSQRIAPIALVPAGTPGAQPATISANPTSNAGPAAKPMDMGHTQAVSTSTSTSTSTATDTSSTSTTESTGSTGKHKFWIFSTGMDYIGSQITVKVNGAAMDSFYAPGKILDVTPKVKAGDNTIAFEPKVLGPTYNKHKNDAKAELVLKLVSGPFITENFKQSDVIATYKRNATEEDENPEVEHFVK